MNVDRRYCRIVIDTCKDYNKYRDYCFRFTFHNSLLSHTVILWYNKSGGFLSAACYSKIFCAMPVP